MTPLVRIRIAIVVSMTAGFYLFLQPMPLSPLAHVVLPLLLALAIAGLLRGRDDEDGRREAAAVIGHTPGPWTTEAREAGTWIRGPLGENIAIVLYADREVGLANAGLTAAAPDMLFMLQTLAPLIGSVDELLGDRGAGLLGPKVHALIAKAEGR